MFPDEPEGHNYEELRQHIGAASALGSAIEIKLKNGKTIKAFVNNSQDNLPEYLKLFLPKNEVEKDIIKIKTHDIIWFKLLRYGRTESFIDKNGVPTAKLPILIINARKLKGNGKIINPGITSIRSEEIDFKGEILSYENNKNEK